MPWEVNVTDEFADWYHNLDNQHQESVMASVELLEESGPLLDRPDADHIKASRHHNMKELRPRRAAKHCRILFAFDPRRQAILLIGGDKSGDWNKWYTVAIPKADDLYDQYLAQLADEGLIDPT